MPMDLAPFGNVEALLAQCPTHELWKPPVVVSCDLAHPPAVALWESVKGVVPNGDLPGLILLSRTTAIERLQSYGGELSKRCCERLLFFPAGEPLGTPQAAYWLVRAGAEGISFEARDAAGVVLVEGS